MFASLGSSVVLHWFGHIFMMQMVSFNFWFWFGFWSSFQTRISLEIHLFYSDWTLCPYETCIMGSLGSSVVIYWFVHIFMMQMVSFNFVFWFGFWSSFQTRISLEIHLFYPDWTLCAFETCILGSLGRSVVIHWNGHNSMMQMVSFNFWFWFGFWCSFKPRIILEIHLFYSDWTLCPYETCIMGSLGSSVVIYWFVHIFMMQMVSFNFGFWFGFWCSFKPRIIPEIHLFYSDWTICS